MDAQIPIVDEHDQVITHIPRKDVTANDIFRASGLWLENSKDEVLIAQRKLTKPNDPGLWGPAASGTVEKGETYESNVIKEAEEELGLTRIQPVFVDKLFQASPRKQFCAVFKVVCEYPAERFVIQEDEVEQIRWIAKAQLKQEFQENPKLFVPSMHAFIALFITR